MKGKDYYSKLKQRKKQIAEQQIAELFLKAEEAFSSNSKVSDRCVRKARRMAMKHKIRLPKELKIRFCKHCNAYLSLSVNCRVRLSGGKVVYYCLACKKYMRFPYTKEKKKRLRLPSSEKRKIYK